MPCREVSLEQREASITHSLPYYSPQNEVATDATFSFLATPKSAIESNI